MMLRRSIEILALLGGLALGHIVAQERYWCGDAKPLPLEYPRSAPFKLDNLVFSSADEHSYGQVELSAAPIEDFIFIVELVDASGRHVISVPIDSKKPNDSSEFDSAVPNWYPASGLKAWHWDRTLRPLNGSEAVQFWTPLVPSTCPSSARLVGAQVRYRDGKSFRYRESELTLDPTLAKAPITNSQKWFDLMPFEFTGQIHINTSGHPEVTELKSTSETEGQWLKDEIASWTFSPALVNGQRTATDVGFYLIVGTGKGFDLSIVERLRNESDVASILVLRVLPLPPSGRWELELDNWHVF